MVISTFAPVEGLTVNRHRSMMVWTFVFEKSRLWRRLNQDDSLGVIPVILNVQVVDGISQQMGNLLPCLQKILGARTRLIPRKMDIAVSMIAPGTSLDHDLVTRSSEILGRYDFPRHPDHCRYHGMH